MSGWRPWGGYGLALGLVFLTTGCARQAKPPAPEEPASPEAEAQAEPEKVPGPAVASAPTEETQDRDLRLKGIKLVEDEGQTGLFIKLSRVPDKVEHFALNNPARLVIDVQGP